MALKVGQRRQSQIKRSSELDYVFALGNAVLIIHGIHNMARSKGIDLESWVQGFEQNLVFLPDAVE